MPSFDGLAAKFKALDFFTSKKNLIQPEKLERNEFEIENEEIAALGQHPEAEALIKRLNKRVDELDAQMIVSLHSHPDMCALQGAKQEVRAIITQLEGKEKEDGR